MRRISWAGVAFGLLIAIGLASPASAQATRTWVSGVGDDANPCSRTAPCKTFAGAISKTAAAGEINCLDPGGFGTVTITKAITISCEAGTAGIAASGTFGVTVNAGAADVVHLKGLDIDGYGTGVTGIRFLAGSALVVQDTAVRGFTTANGLGIQVATSATSSFTMINSSITRNGNASSGGGIQIAPATGSLKVALTNVTVAANFVGIAATGAGSNTTQIMNSTITNNAGTGIITGGAGVVRIGRSAITNNLGASSSGTLLSYLDNQINGNSPDVTPSSAGGYK